MVNAASDQERGPEHGSAVQAMFSRIASRYDLMNRLMTAGQDAGWRERVVQLARINPGNHILDLGTGTGDLAFLIQKTEPHSRVIAVDFTVAMMQVGQTRPGGEQMAWSAGDSLRLPFSDETFDAIVSGFLLRNVSSLDMALAEHWRVLKPGGRWVSLDTTRPADNWLKPFVEIHLRYVIPGLGQLLTGDSSAYQYLPESTRNFLSAEDLAHRVSTAGFEDVQFERKMFGTIAIHSARKSLA